MADNYHRLVCFVVDICCEPLRKLFLKLANTDSLHTFSNLSSYLTQRKPHIYKLRLRPDQWQLLFPASATPDENKWDVTLLVMLIKNLFKIQPLIGISLDEIRTIRNELQHISSTNDIANDKFEDYWMRLEAAAITLANDVSGGSYEAEIRKQITETRNNNLPSLGVALCNFYEENGKEMKNELRLVKEELNHVKQEFANLNATMTSVASNSEETMSTLRNICVTNGNTKRLKTVDDVLWRLIKQFKLTIHLMELSGNFTPPEEIDQIETKLRDSHNVIIAGSRSSHSLKTALYVINNLKYDHSRCAEMNDPSEWLYIDEDDVDLVLCRDPFGKPLYDVKKASDMMKILDRIHYAVRRRDGGKHLDFILVTEVECLAEMKRSCDHELLGEVVMLPTSENQPVDLTAGTDQSSKTFGHKMDFCRYMTETILEDNSNNNPAVDQLKIDEASEKLLRNRMVTISGPPKSGKTSTAVALAKKFSNDEVLFLCSPDDIKNIDRQTTLLVVIDDFGGKYLFDRMKINEWYNCLDLLYTAVNSGKIQVIVIGETKRLQSCVDTVASHPILSNPIYTEIRPTLIKKEHPAKDVDQCVRAENSSCLQVVRSIQSVTEYNVRVESDKDTCIIWGSCVLPSGEILLADYSNSRLKKLDIDFNVTNVCDLNDKPRDLCYVGNNVAVVAVYECQLVYVDISRLTVKNIAKTEHVCTRIISHNDKMYVTSDDTVYMYTINGNYISVLYKIQNTSSFIIGIAMNATENRIYISHADTELITIDGDGNLLNSLTLPDIYALSVDDRDNVWVSSDSSNTLFQVSADCTALLGTLFVDTWNETSSLCFDMNRSALILTDNDKICIVRLN